MTTGSYAYLLTRVKPTVAARMLRLNGVHLGEGAIIRGYSRKPLSWRRAKKRLQRCDSSLRQDFRLAGGKRVFCYWLEGPVSDHLLAAWGVK